MVRGETPRLVVAGDLEAAEALVGLRRRDVQDQPAVGADYAPTRATIPEKIVGNNPSQTCSTSYKSNPVAKKRPKLTQAEKEERKFLRVLSNRESARETIRRRKAVHAELTNNAAEVLEENEHLKKEKELALEKYNSLKRTYKIFKSKLDEVKKAAADQTEQEPKAAEICGPSTSNPIFLHNQPPIIPYFWPPILSSSDVFPFHYSSHSHSRSLPQYPMPHGDEPCSHQGQEHSMGNIPLLVYPVPWLLPFLTQGTNDRTNTCSRCSCSNSQQHEDTNQLPPHQNVQPVQQDAGHPPGQFVVPGLFSPVRPLENIGPPWGCQVDEACDVNVVSSPEDRPQGSSNREKEPMKPEDVFATTMARRRRKELMKLKNVHS